MDRRLVDHLVNSSIVSRAAMQRMILRASKDKTSIIDQLLLDEKIDEEAVARELATYYDLEVVPKSFSVNETALKFISKSMADKHGVLPFAVSESADHVTVAVYNPESAQSVVDSLKTATGREPTVQVAARSWLSQAIRHYYFEEPWADAPVNNAATREVADVVEDLSSSLGADESSEIVLDEVVVPPVPRPRVRNDDDTPLPEGPPPEREKDATPMPPPQPKTARRASKKETTSREAPRSQERRSTRPGIEADSEVDQALDEFDAFLDKATGWGNRSGTSGIPGWDDDDEADENPFSMKATAAGWDNPSPSNGGSSSGFSLFDDGPEESGSLQAVVDEHEELIERLRREIQQQREIITALVDALADAGVVSKREIKHRMKRK